MSFLFRLISILFKTIYRGITFLGSLFVCLLFLLLIGLAGFSFLKPDNLTVADNSILRLTLSGDIVEQYSQEDPYLAYADLLIGRNEPPRETLLQDILDTIYHAESDSHITALLLDVEHLGNAGLNQLEAIGSALSSFRKSGKPIISIEDSYTQSQYYLAAHSTSIYINPMGSVNLHGFGMYRFYFKDALEKLKVDFHVFRVGDHKSAIEPLTRNSMSGEDRGQTREWLSALWHNYTQDVAAQRSLKPDDIDRYINAVPGNLEEAEGDLATLALNSGLVDGLKTRAEIRSLLKDTVQAESEDDVSIVSSLNYISLVEPLYGVDPGDTDQVGLIIASGTITDGYSTPGTIGAETITTLLRTARESEQIKAVVLRVDTGGGSAFASELIRQEILELKKSGKPVLVSMGAYAASGGYWISADADQIWASANTLTGSIGIFMAFPTFEKLLTSGGIHRDGVGTTNLSAGFDLSHPPSEELSQALQLVLENGYERFISLVAAGRNLDRTTVEALAHGRVYAGTRARQIGLVDEIGDLEQTIGAAAIEAGLGDYKVTPLQPEESFQSIIFSRLNATLYRAGHALTELLFPQSSWLKTVYETTRPITSIVQRFLIFPDPNGMYAHCMIGYF